MSPLDIPNFVGASLVTTLYKVLQGAQRELQRERDLYEMMTMEEEHSQKRQSRGNQDDKDTDYSEGYNDNDVNDTNAAATNMVVSGDQGTTTKTIHQKRAIIVCCRLPLNHGVECAITSSVALSDYK